MCTPPDTANGVQIGFLWIEWICLLPYANPITLITCIPQVFFLAFCKYVKESKRMNAIAEPKLAPPGAGLPKPELLIARLIFSLQSRTGNRASFNKRFTQERDAIRKLVDSCNETSAATRVLIDRVPGLEDSSRFWSAWMTLDHLRIMNHGIARTIDSLVKGISPNRKASTASVKPSPDVDATIRDAYEKSCDALLETVSAAPNLKTTARFTHPWFGPLDASSWHALAGTHMSIHRKQIERIIAGLPAAARTTAG
jgi:uncharacterized damage-inducible protein DinB